MIPRKRALRSRSISSSGTTRFGNDFVVVGRKRAPVTQYLMARESVPRCLFTLQITAVSCDNIANHDP